MDKLDTQYRAHFFWLILWRGLVGLVALYVVVEKPLSTALVSLAVLGALILVGEVIHRYFLHLEQRREYEERQRQLRQKREEEVRQKYEQMKTSQNGKKSLFGLHEDSEDVPQGEANKASPGMRKQIPAEAG